MLIETIEDLQAAVEARGIATTIYPKPPPARLVCAGVRSANGLGGNSLWFSIIDGIWYVTTWALATYRVPPATNLASLCSKCIHSDTCAISRIPDFVVGEFCLIEVSYGDIYGSAQDN